MVLSILLALDIYIKKDFLLIQRKLGSKIPLVKEDRILNYSQGSNWNVQDAELSHHRRTKPPKSFRNLPLFHPKLPGRETPHIFSCKNL